VSTAASDRPDGTRLTVRLPADAPLQGQSIELAFDPSALHLFDENGRALPTATARGR
jgi:hypothetical protein